VDFGQIVKTKTLRCPFNLPTSTCHPDFIDIVLNWHYNHTMRPDTVIRAIGAPAAVVGANGPDVPFIPNNGGLTL